MNLSTTSLNKSLRVPAQLGGDAAEYALLSRGFRQSHAAPVFRKIIDINNGFIIMIAEARRLKSKDVPPEAAHGLI